MSSLVVTEIFSEVGGLFLAIVIVPLSKAGETIFLELISLIIMLENDKFIWAPTVADELILVGIFRITLSFPVKVLFVGEYAIIL